MFSWIRTRVGVFSSGRYPLRINSQLRRGEIQNVQPVRLSKRSPFRPKRLLTYGVVALSCNFVYQTLVFGPLIRAYDDLEKNMDDATRKELEKAKEEDESLFIPFPGTTRKITPGPYRGSDPEWQEFIRINGDDQLTEKIRDDLAERIRYICANSQHYTKPLGEQMKIRRCWLDIYYPTRPPPEYERSGIEITDDYIAWTTMPVDALTVGRIQRALWPSDFVRSAHAFIKVLFSQNSAYISTVLGLQPKTQASYEALVTLRKASHNAANGSNIGTPATPTTRNPHPGGAPDMINANTANSKTTSSTSKKLNAIEAQIDKPTISTRAEWLKPSFDLIQEHMSEARKAFRRKWNSRLGSIYADPPRGSISVSGLVEMESNKAILLMDVFAHWDPKTKEFDPLSLIFKPRRVVFKPRSSRGSKEESQ